MPLNDYGMLKGRPINRQLASGASPHYQIHIVDDTTHYRIAVNVTSQLAPSELEFLVDSKFDHPVLAELIDKPLGWFLLPSRPGGMALDFIRSNLFDPRDMRVLPLSAPGPDNDLNEKIDQFVQRAMADEDALVYAFGQRWGPENKTDKIFGFMPGNGVHDIHMNQANVGRFRGDDGVYQDGALLFNFPRTNQWVGVISEVPVSNMAHRRQDGASNPYGNQRPPIGCKCCAQSLRPRGGNQRPRCRTGQSGSFQRSLTVSSPPRSNLFRCSIPLTQRSRSKAGKSPTRDKNKMPLKGSIAAGETLRIQLVPPVFLPNKGGIITVLNDRGLRIDGVAYTKEQARNPGWTIKF